jgi:hypothetical protein
MNCEFEEKQYEWFLNYELAEKGQVYPSGQFLENDLGIDAAVFSRNPQFWDLWNKNRKTRYKAGLRLSPELWDNAERILKSDMFPSFKCNVFIQDKRPESVSSPNGRERKKFPHWKQPYFRYRIDQHQQGILNKLEEKTSSYAIVAYACPSFWKRRDLWGFVSRGKLIENSNFAQPHRLQGHRRYTFVRSGKHGYACSEPIKIEGIDILSEIRRTLEKSLRFKDNVQFLNTLARDIKTVIEELDDESREGFFAVQRGIEYPEHELGRSIMTILAFNLFANTSWGIGYEIKHESPKNHNINGLERTHRQPIRT